MMRFARNCVILTILYFLLLTSCSSSAPIQIGFVAELSGRNAVLGVQGRNGAQLAVDSINAKGGINGRQLKLVISDNTGSPDVMAKADQQLIDDGIQVISGHMTSWEAVAAYDLIEAEQVLLFSPTASTPELTGKKDHFFRLIPSNVAQAYPLAEYGFNELGLRRATLLYDAENAAFAQTFSEGFIERFQDLGGEVIGETSFRSQGALDYATIIADLKNNGGADTLTIIASSFDTALFAQQVKLQEWDVQILSSNWAYTDELIHNGGRAVEDIIITSQFNGTCQNPRYLDFKTQYERTYGGSPAFMAVFAYETMEVLAAAFQKTGGQAQGLEQAILELPQIEGLCDQIRIDEYGDVQRSLYIITVKNGHFEILQTRHPMP